MAALPPRLGKTLRTALRRFHTGLDPVAEQLPETAAALAQLEEALDAELPPYPRAMRVGRRRAYANLDADHANRLLRWRLANLKRALKKAKQDAKSLKQPFAHKQRGVTVPLMVKVALSYPPNNARQFARSLRDLLGEDSVGLHRKGIDAIRDQFAEEVKSQMNCVAELQIASAVKAFSDGATAVEHHTVAVLHIHDEAAVRLRSFLKDAAAAEGRGRVSSVQCHVVTLFAAPGAGHPILVELDALANKSGETLATSLNGVVLPMMAAARRGVDAIAVNAPIFFVHVVVCDAVSANEKAARILLACHGRVAPSPGVRYFLMLVKCANHQANLVVSSAVDGFLFDVLAHATHCRQAHRGVAATAVVSSKALPQSVGACRQRRICFVFPVACVLSVVVVEVFVAIAAPGWLLAVVSRSVIRTRDSHVGPSVARFAAKVSARQAATTFAPGDADPLPARNASDDAKTAPHRLACGAIVRLFKYLINAYYSEFYASLVAHVQTLRITVDVGVAAERDAAEGGRKAAALEALYGECVFPKGLRTLLNAGFDRWEHRVPPESVQEYRASPDEYAARVRGALVELLRHHLLVVDEHPTYTRMFTFNGNLNKLLLFAVLGISRSVLRFVAVAPREDWPRRRSNFDTTSGCGMLDCCSDELSSTGQSFGVAAQARDFRRSAGCI